ncbi:MAG: CCC motif membrane protein [Bacteroidales bacterium]
MENQNFNPNQQPPQGGFYQQPPVPNSTAVLVLGILSIVICCGFVGVILGIIALSLSGKAGMLYKSNPGMYSLASYNNLKAGRICAIIGTALSALYIIYIIIYVVFLGAALTAFPWEMYQH